MGLAEGERALCFYHTGHEARIRQCEKNDEDIFARLRALEMAVWKAAGATGAVTGIVIVLLERWLQG